ncbi:hypothetical protein V8C86DRAFT_605585 [Haematococcus lacustris]
MALPYLLSPSAWTRLVGAACGAAVAGVTYLALERQVWRNAADACGAYGQVHAPLLPKDDYVWGPRTRALAIQAWNRGVDSTVGYLAAEASKHGL